MTQPQINSSAPFRMPPLPFLVPGILSLLLGLAAGLTRLPWELPAFGSVTMLHGPLMVSGFLGTVMGITLAIANITPDQLETSMGAVTGRAPGSATRNVPA